MLFQHIHYGKTKGNVGNKNPVHHIHMIPAGITVVDHFTVSLKVAEIGRKHRRSNND